ncbi:11997_t:CDS:2 [Funneliformis caledonium]|uniref:11997_t:CDS:1 n=1 Tax=Funneliformis caledonium TaxID=1117310 RepID=A0A9N9FX16_9GLOM|nr:11997_t:CDS:2 [Funneliformis caledonium]
MSINTTDVFGDPYSDPSIPYEEFPENPKFGEDVANYNQKNLFKYLNSYLSTISVIGGLIVLVIIIFMYFYDKKLVNRVSLRLSAMISFVDVLSGVTVIAYAYYQPRETPECTSIAFGMSFFPQLYLFLTVMIAFNLQIVFLHRKKVSSFSDRWYIPVAFLMAIFINILPLVYHKFGYDPDTRDCIYRHMYDRDTKWWKFATFLIPVSISMIYCTTVLTIVVCKLVFEHRQLAEAIHSQNSVTLSAKRRHKLLLLKLVGRIALYAAIPLLTVCGIVVEYVWISLHANSENDVPMALNYWAIVGSCLPGFFNCIAFLFDPAIHNAFRRVKKDLIEKYGYPKRATISPPMSPSDAVFPNSPTQNPRPSHLLPPSPSNHPTLATRISFTNSRVSPSNFSKPKKNNRFIRWFVRKFMDKKVIIQPPMVLLNSTSFLSTTLGSDQGCRYSSTTVNSGTLTGQSFDHDHDYHRIELNSPTDKRMKRTSHVLNIPEHESPNSTNLEYTNLTSVTGNSLSPTSACNSLGDSSRLLYENCSFGSYSQSPILGNNTIDIQYPVSHFEAGIPSPLSGVSSSHRRSESESSTASRDSVDNDLAAY